jgi:hypothetical protein
MNKWKPIVTTTVDQVLDAVKLKPNSSVWSNYEYAANDLPLMPRDAPPPNPPPEKSPPPPPWVPPPPPVN